MGRYERRNPRCPPRKPRPYITHLSAEFLAILPAAKAELEALELGSNGQPKHKMARRGRPKGSKNLPKTLHGEDLLQ
jgi:hypothetical protein